MREFEYPVLDCEAIGGRIREERVRRSFTIQEVCDALSVSPQAVGKWQRGESLPSIDNLVALCTLFDVSLEGILFGEDRMSFRYMATFLKRKNRMRESAVSIMKGGSWFQRVFSCICGMTVAEYVRKRRMTLATMDLKERKERVIDVAVKYGYDSADAFSRAFTAFHGITPTMARESDARIKSFSPMRFRLSVDGTKETKYRLERREAMRVVGVMRHFKAPENGPQDVGSFWNELFGNGVYERIAELAEGQPVGVHGFLHVLDDTHVDYMIGTVTERDCPEDMEEQEIPASTWAIFEQTGSVQSSMADMWKQIFEEWLPSTEYEHAGTAELECFCHGGDRRENDFRYEIWIPVRKRRGQT